MYDVNGIWISPTRNEIRFEDNLLIGPRVEALDLEEVKKQRRFSSTSLDTLFDMWMGAAREQFEEETGLQLLTALRCFSLDRPPVDRRIELSRAPVQSIESVTYDDADGVTQVFSSASYRQASPIGAISTYPPLAQIELMPGASWPSVGAFANAFRINYWAGYGDAPGAVPNIIQFALMMWVGSFHKFAEEVTELESKSVVLQALPLGAQRVVNEAKYRTKRTLVPRCA